MHTSDIKLNHESDEAFPNAEHVFQQAFAAQDPAPLLLHILKTHPTYPALRDVVFCYVEAVYNDPYRVQTLACALLPSISHSTDAHQNFSLASWRGHTSYLTTTTTTMIKCTDKEHIPSRIAPIWLFVQQFTTWSAKIYASIENGLKKKNRRSSKTESNLAVLVVGTCIQLLLHTSGIDEKPRNVQETEGSQDGGDGKRFTFG